MALRIGLLSTLNTNIGDDFIRAGIVSVIDELRKGESTQWMVINKHRPMSAYTPWQRLLRFFSARSLKAWDVQAKLLERFPSLEQSRFDPCDLIIQCGTPVLWSGCSRSEWAEPIWRDVFHRLSRHGKRVLNIGGGSTYGWEKLPETLLGNPDEAFVTMMLETCQLTTARDRLTQKLYASLGHNTEVVCCPAILAGQSLTSPLAGKKKVYINYMQGGGHYDWGQGIDPWAWEHTVRSVVENLRKQGWEVIMLAHDAKEYALARRIWPTLPCKYPRTLKAYFETIRDAAFGVFNRMHASIAAAGLGIPSIAIGTDARNLMVAQAGLPVFYVKEATVDRLMQAVEQIVDDRASESRRLLELTAATRQRYLELLAPILRT